MTDVAPELLEPLADICLALPDAYQEPAWVGVRWRVRGRTFAHVFTIDADSTTVLRGEFSVDAGGTAVTFRVSPDELPALREAGHPYYYAGWGRDVMGLHLDAGTDWGEVAEVLTDSYCVLAPRKLVDRVDRPPAPDLDPPH